MTDTPSRANIESNEYIGVLGTRARNTRIISVDPVEGTAAEMAADAAAIILAGTEVANQGKRWENTTDGLVYDFRPVSGTWGYYLETNADASGNVPVVSKGAVNTYVQMMYGAIAVTDFMVKSGTVTDLAEQAVIDISGVMVIINPTSDTDARDKLFAGTGEFLQAGYTQVLESAAGITSVALVGLANVANGAAPNLNVANNKFIGSIKRTNVASSASDIAASMITLTPVSPITSIEIALSISQARNETEFGANMYSVVRGIA